MNLRSAAGAAWRRQSCRWVTARQPPPGCCTIMSPVSSCCSMILSARISSSARRSRTPSTTLLLPSVGSFSMISLRHQSTTTTISGEKQNLPLSFYTTDQKQVMDRCKELHSSIMDLNERVSWLSTNCYVMGAADVSMNMNLSLCSWNQTLIPELMRISFMAASWTFGPTFGSGHCSSVCVFGRQPFVGKVVLHQLCLGATSPDSWGRSNRRLVYHHCPGTGRS